MGVCVVARHRLCLVGSREVMDHVVGCRRLNIGRLVRMVLGVTKRSAPAIAILGCPHAAHYDRDLSRCDLAVRLGIVA